MTESLISLEHPIDIEARGDLLGGLSSTFHSFKENYLTIEFAQSYYDNLATLQNLIFLGLIVQIAVIFYYIGVNKGSDRAFSLLQHKYSNMELHKRKIIRTITRADSLNKHLTTVFRALIGGEVCTFVYMVYLRREDLLGFFIGFGFDMIFLLLGLLLIGTVYLARVLMVRTKDKYRTKLGVFYKDQQELAKDLIHNLGNDLTNLLKQALVAAQNNAEKQQIAKLKEDVEKRRKEMEQLSQQLKSKDHDLNVKAQEVKTLQTSLATVQSQTQQAFGSISAGSSAKYMQCEREIANYKEALKRITAFEWCENCSDKGLQFQSSTVEKLKLSDPSGLHSPAKSVRSDSEQTTENTSENIQKQPSGVHEGSEQISKSHSLPRDSGDANAECTNQCLQRYFEMASEVNHKFNKEKRLIDQIKKTLQTAKA